MEKKRGEDHCNPPGWTAPKQNAGCLLEEGGGFLRPGKEKKRKKGQEEKEESALIRKKISSISIESVRKEGEKGKLCHQEGVWQQGSEGRKKD